jgi:hypothetical protein
MDGLAPTALVRPPSSEKATRRGLRLGLGTLLWLIAATAPVVALFVRLEDPQWAVPVTLVVVLTGLAVGAARRAKGWQVGAQIGLTACIGLAVFELDARDESGLGFIYILLALFTATIVAPLMIRNAFEEGAGCRPRIVKTGADVAWNVGLHTAALIGFLVMVEMAGLTLTGTGTNCIARTVRTPEERIAAETGDDPDDPVEPASLQRSTGPFPRGCEARVLPEPEFGAGVR